MCGLVPLRPGFLNCIKVPPSLATQAQVWTTNKIIDIFVSLLMLNYHVCPGSCVHLTTSQPWNSSWFAHRSFTATWSPRTCWWTARASWSSATLASRAHSRRPARRSPTTWPRAGTARLNCSSATSTAGTFTSSQITHASPTARLLHLNTLSLVNITHLQCFRRE